MGVIKKMIFVPKCLESPGNIVLGYNFQIEIERDKATSAEFPHLIL